MALVRAVTPLFFVAGQLNTIDVGEAARWGVRLVINNRPDGEEPGQPSSLEIEAAAQAAGMGYLYAPVRGMPTRQQVEDVDAALSSEPGPVLAFCRSGMRSIFTWALAEQAAGRRRRAELLDLARAAGYDLSAYLPADQGAPE